MAPTAAIQISWQCGAAMELDCQFTLQKSSFTLDAELTENLAGITGITGPSGAGKTTFLRCLAGLEQPTSGHIRMDVQTWFGEQKSIPSHQRRIGYVFQDSGLFTHLDVEQNLAYGYRRLPVSERRIEYKKVIDGLNLYPLLTRDVSMLSGGEKQRVALGRVLLASPKLLLLDEPLSALDIASKNSLLAVIRQVVEQFKTPALYVSHSMTELATLADTVLYMQGGKFIIRGSVNELLTRPDLPFANEQSAFVVFEGKNTKYVPADQLSAVETAAGTLLIVGKINDGALRLQIHARDVSLCLNRPQDSSILNILPATVFDIVPGETGQVMVHLEIGDAMLMARISHKSAHDLKLKVGKKLFAQIKSVAFQ